VSVAGNVVRQINKPPANEKQIMEMQPGEIGYTVPWAMNNGDNINLLYHVHLKPGGTSTLKVKCVAPGQYEIDWTGVKK